MIKKYAAIEEQVKKVIDFSNDMDCVTGKLMQSWLRGKRRLIAAFGEELIIESPKVITVNKPDEDKILEYRDYVDKISYSCANEELRAFLIFQGWTAFYANSVRETWNNYGIKVSKGMKISKALKLFISDQEELTAWQTNYSRIIQDVKVYGKLCLSIHPLDYLTISETSHKWRSCHSLDGEFRAGNLSYMLDEVTVVAYLKSEKDYNLPGFPKDMKWNSKKWRMLMYINLDKDMIFSSKPYPFDNEMLVNASYTMLEQVFDLFPWPKDYSVMEPDNAIDYMQDHPDSLQFNDCLCSISFEPRYKCATNKTIDECRSIVVGAPVYCLECENELIEFGADYSCMDCGDYVVCDYCGCHMYSDEAYELDDQTMCPSCYDDAVVWCDGCGEANSRENPEMVYSEEEDVWNCPDCYDAMITAEES